MIFSFFLNFMLDDCFSSPFIINFYLFNISNKFTWGWDDSFCRPSLTCSYYCKVVIRHFIWSYLPFVEMISVSFWGICSFWPIHWLSIFGLLNKVIRIPLRRPTLSDSISHNGGFSIFLWFFFYPFMLICNGIWGYLPINSAVDWWN